MKKVTFLMLLLSGWLLAGEKYTVKYRIEKINKGINVYLSPKLGELGRRQEEQLVLEMGKAAGPQALILIGNAPDETKISILYWEGDNSEVIKILAVIQKRLNVKLQPAPATPVG